MSRAVAFHVRASRRCQALTQAAALLALLTPLWSSAECNPDLTANVTPAQYRLNPDTTVTDTVNRLTWKRCPEGFVWMQTACAAQADAQQMFTWQQALVHAANNEPGKGWRLPNTKELESLLKRNCANPAIEETVFSNLSLANHWSSTPAIGYYGNAWAVSFRDGSHITADKTNAYMVRLVRDEP